MDSPLSRMRRPTFIITNQEDTREQPEAHTEVSEAITVAANSAAVNSVVVSTEEANSVAVSTEEANSVAVSTEEASSAEEKTEKEVNIAEESTEEESIEVKEEAVAEEAVAVEREVKEDPTPNIELQEVAERLETLISHSPLERFNLLGSPPNSNEREQSMFSAVDPAARH